MKTTELISAAAERAASRYPKPWEGGSHLMRYIKAAVDKADSQWKVSEDEEINGLRLNSEDASQAIKIAGALFRFFEQVGAEEVARVAGADFHLELEKLRIQAEDAERQAKRLEEQAKDAWYSLPQDAGKSRVAEFVNVQLAEPWIERKLAAEDQVHPFVENRCAKHAGDRPCNHGFEFPKSVTLVDNLDGLLKRALKRSAALNDLRSVYKNTSYASPIRFNRDKLFFVIQIAEGIAQKNPGWESMGLDILREAASRPYETVILSRASVAEVLGIIEQYENSVFGEEIANLMRGGT